MMSIVAAAESLAPLNGENALFRCESAEEVNALVALGLDVNARNKNNTTPLIRAATQNHLEVVEALIAAGADVNNNKVGSLYFAARQSHCDIVSALLAAGANPNSKTNNGWMPLHAAVYHDRIESAKALIAAGADVTAKTDRGRTCIELCKSSAMKALFVPAPVPVAEDAPAPAAAPDFSALLAALKATVVEIEKLA